MLSSEGGLGTPEPAGSPQVGFTLGYPSGLAVPTEASALVSGQMLTTLTGTDIIPPHTGTLYHPPQPQHPDPRQPPPVTAAATDLTLPSTIAEQPTHATARTRSLSPPILSPAPSVEQPGSVLHERGRARSQREPSLSPNQWTGSYCSPARLSDIEVEFPSVKPSAFQPRLVDVYARRSGSATGPRQLESATSVGACVHPAASARPTVVDVTSACAHERSVSPTRSTVIDVGQSVGDRPAIVDAPRQLSLVRPTVVDVARPSGPESLDVAMSVRPPGSVVSAGVRECSAILARPVFVDVGGRQGLGRPMTVDTVRLPGLAPPAYVDFVQQADPQPADVDVASALARPTSADVTYQPGAATTTDAAVYHPPTWTGPKPAYASQYAAVRTDVAVHTSAETLIAQSLLLLGRHAASPQSSPHSSVHQWL